MIRSIDPSLMSPRIGRIGLVGGVILLGMAGCASGPGESDLLPDEDRPRCKCTSGTWPVSR